MKAGDWIEIDILCQAPDEPLGLKSFLEERFKRFVDHYPTATIESDDSRLRSKELTCIRKARRPGEGIAALHGFVDFPQGIQPSLPRPVNWHYR